MNLVRVWPFTRGLSRFISLDCLRQVLINLWLGSSLCRGYTSLEIAEHLGVLDRAQAIGGCVAHGVVSPAELRRIFQA